MRKFSKIALWVLMGIGIVMTILYYMYKGPQFSSTEDYWTGLYLGWAYVSFAIALILVIVLPFVTPSSGKKNTKKTIISIVAIIVVVGIAWLLSTDAPVELVGDNAPDPSALTLKLTDAGLKLAYILVAVAAIAIVGGSVYSAVKK